MRFKKTLSLFLVLGLTVTGLTGCGGGSTSVTDTSSDTATVAESTTDATVPADTAVLTVGINQTLASFDPFAAESMGNDYVISSFYEKLAVRSQLGGDLIGVIMKDYTMVNDKTYDINIFDTVHDSAGNPIKAEDVAWCLQTAKDSGNFNEANAIETVTVTGDYSLEITFNSDRAGVFEAAVSTVLIVSKTAYEASTDKMANDPIGTGPYKLKDYVSGSTLTVEKTGDYWQTDATLVAPTSKSNYDSIVYKIITEPSQMTVALETGEIDIADTLDTSEVKRFQDGGEDVDKFNVYSFESNLINSMIFNIDASSVCSNLALRQAISYAVDKQGILDGAANGLGEVCKTLGNKLYGDYQTSWDSEDYYDVNLDKAKELLTESGFDTSKKIRIITNNSTSANMQAQLIQAYIGQIGLTAEIDAYDNALYQTYIHDPSMYDINVMMVANSDYNTSIGWFMFDSRNYGGTTINFAKDDQLQSIIENVITVAGHTDENINAYHEYVKDQCYAIGLYYGYSYYAFSKTIDSVYVDYKGFMVAGASEPVK